MRLLATAALAAGLLTVAAAAVAPRSSSLPSLTVTEIIDRNIVARGGLEAWRKVQTMVWVGHVEGAQSSGRAMPFVLELKRPNLTHFEINAAANKFTRIFDGKRGWKVRPTQNGAPETKPFSNEEVKYAKEEFVIDGPLIDHQAKGVAVTLEGVDELEGRKAYRLTLKLPSGAARRLWIDAETFLETRYDRPSTSPLHPGATASVYYSNYRSVDGLMIPMRIEHGSAAGLAVNKAQDKLVIDRVSVNPVLPVASFAKPAVARQRSATVNTGVPMPPSARGPGVPSQ